LRGAKGRQLLKVESDDLSCQDSGESIRLEAGKIVFFNGHNLEA
jgi:hypothetical protein